MLTFCPFFPHRQEGAEFLARHGFDGREATVAAEYCEADDEEQEEQKSDDDEPSPKRLKRQSTMAATAKVNSEFIIMLFLVWEVAGVGGGRVRLGAP